MPATLDARQAILFDLDGTLVDTAADITAAVNRLMAELGSPGLPESVVRTMIGGGALLLVERAFARQGVPLGERERLELMRRYLIHYADLLESGTSTALPYPGAQRALSQLADAGLPLAVVTNKEQRLAARVLEETGLSRYVDLLVGGDGCWRRKPDPAMLLHACAAFGVEPAAAVEVGDSVNDVLAARAAGMPVILVSYGYHGADDARRLGSDACVDSLTEVPGRIAVRATGVAAGAEARGRRRAPGTA
jgi:phosphoglycolate phosphatase